MGTGGGAGNNSHMVQIATAIIGAVALVLAAIFGPQVVVNVTERGEATAEARLEPTIAALENQTGQVARETVEVPVTRVVEVTREVPVTQVVEVTREVIVTPVVAAALATAVPTPLPISFSDDFNGPLKTEWSYLIPGGFATDNGRLRGQSDYNAKGFLLYEVTGSNYRIKMNVEGVHYLIHFRSSAVRQQLTNGYAFGCDRYTCFWWIIRDGKFAQLATVDRGEGFPFNEPTELTLEIKDTVFTAFINNGQVLSSITNDEISSGFVGIQSARSSDIPNTYGIFIDYFTIEPLE